MNLEPQEIVVELEGVQIAVKRWGEPNAKPILALHGWLDNSGSFDYLAPLLKSFQVFAIDLPGHGLSGHWPKGMSYHSIDGVGTLAHLIRHWNWEKVILMGHSMGASIASLFAGTFPEQLDKLILLEGLGPLTSPAEEAPARLKRSILQHSELSTKQLPVYSDIDRAIEVRKQVSGMSEKATRPLVQRGIKEFSGGFTWRTDPRLKMESPYRMTEPQVIAFLKEISCPTLWIQARQGLKWDPWIINERTRAVKDLKTFEIEGNHHVHLEDPEKVAEIILSFL